MSDKKPILKPRTVEKSTSSANNGSLLENRILNLSSACYLFRQKEYFSCFFKKKMSLKPGVGQLRTFNHRNLKAMLQNLHLTDDGDYWRSVDQHGSNSTPLNWCQKTIGLCLKLINLG